MSKSFNTSSELTGQSYEVWRSIIGYDGLYEVSNQGNIRALFSACRGKYKIGRLLKPKITPNGYFMVGLYKHEFPIKYATIHRLVLGAFIGLRPPGKEARHLDGIKSHNALSNLAWGTHSENIQDTKDHGTMAHGENHVHSKLKNSDVLRIRTLWDGGLSARKISKEFNICVMVAWRIANRKSWKHLPESV